MIDYNQLAAEYAQHRKENPAVLKQLIERGKINTSSHILEVGCGTGNYISALNRLTGCSAFGCDPSREMLAQAGLNGAAAQFQEGRGEALPYPDGSFDLVFSVDVIHHIEDHTRYFLEVSRVLAANGKICTVTESSDLIRQRHPFTTYFPETARVDLQRYPSVLKLKRLMQKAGFAGIHSKVIKLRYERDDIQDFRDRAYSCLHLISNEGFQQGLEIMERDLKNGPLPFISQYLLIWARKE